MTITCIGHSGFAIETKQATLIFDYYIDPSGVLSTIMERATRVYVFVSHSHRDHLCHDIFSWRDRYPIARYIIANECRRKLMRSMNLEQWPMTFASRGKAWTDGTITVQTFGSTDVGVSFMVDVDHRRFFHAGDYTCWHFSEEGDIQQVKKAQGDFHAILRDIVAYTDHLDVAMMPVVPNIGGDFAYGAREFLKAVRCDLFLPMHTWGRDREAAQFHLYQNPAYGKCLLLSTGESMQL